MELKQYFTTFQTLRDSAQGYQYWDGLYGANYSPSSFSVMNLVFFHIHCLLLIIWSPQVPCINISCSPLQVMDWCLVQREGSHVYFLINCHHFDLRQPKTLQELSTKIERILQGEWGKNGWEEGWKFSSLRISNRQAKLITSGALIGWLRRWE